MATSIEEARRAKPKATEAVKSCAVVVGVGLTKVGASYAIKVNLREAAPATANLPDSIDGVQVLYEVVGTISRRDAGGR
jgi:hypothetical protein